MHLALVGAFPFPYPQGSQVFFRESARALQKAGARVTLVCYGRGAGATPPDLALVRARWAPRRLDAGPSLGKPAADLALAAALASAGRGDRFDAVLAHNAEAACAALLVRSALGCPVVYVAHTLLVHELATYGPPRLVRLLSSIGDRIDRSLARRADGLVALSRAGEAALAPHARGPLARIPPGLAAGPAPAPEAVAAACRTRWLEPGRYALYAGNLDRYQDLGALAAAAQTLGAPVVVATHGRGGAPAPLRTLRVSDTEEGRLLAHGAGVLVAPRRALGGFPIKLLNYMETGRPIVARASIADTLVDDESAWLLPDDAPPAAWADAIRTLLDDPARAARLGASARATLARDHDPAALAERTLRLVEEGIERIRRSADPIG